eukprot:2007821-Rhodomonas_salina.1
MRERPSQLRKRCSRLVTYVPACAGTSMAYVPTHIFIPACIHTWYFSSNAGTETVVQTMFLRAS